MVLEQQSKCLLLFLVALKWSQDELTSQTSQESQKVRCSFSCMFVIKLTQVGTT